MSRRLCDIVELALTDDVGITGFIDMLNEMRFGTLSKESIETFRTLHRDPNYTDGIDPTELYVATLLSAVYSS